MEFEKKITVDKKWSKSQEVTVQIELWDCSGDSVFDTNWAAISNFAHGVVYVYSSDSNQEESIEHWCKVFPHLKENQCTIFAHRKQNSPITKPSKPKFSKFLSKVPFVNTSIQHDPEIIRSEFERLLARVFTETSELREKEEKNIIGVTN